MFSLTKPWHWIAVHGHNFIVEAYGFEKRVVQDRAKIEKAEQEIASGICTGLAVVDPAAAIALMKIIPGFSAAFAKCLEALARINGESNSNIVPMEFDSDFVQHLQSAALALESQKPGATTPPAFLAPPVSK
jgi:hypothetical protein